jgi:hypothetical protein
VQQREDCAAGIVIIVCHKPQHNWEDLTEEDRRFGSDVFAARVLVKIVSITRRRSQNITHLDQFSQFQTKDVQQFSERFSVRLFALVRLSPLDLLRPRFAFQRVNNLT